MDGKNAEVRSRIIMTAKPKDQYNPLTSRPYRASVESVFEKILGPLPGLNGAIVWALMAANNCKQEVNNALAALGKLSQE